MQSRTMYHYHARNLCGNTRKLDPPIADIRPDTGNLETTGKGLGTWDLELGRNNYEYINCLQLTGKKPISY